MGENSYDRQMLLDILEALPADMIEYLTRHFAGDLDRSMYLRELKKELALKYNKNKTFSGEETADLHKKEQMQAWRSYTKANNNRFSELMQKYVEMHLKRQRETNRKYSRLDMEETVSSHSKWYRMMKSNGQGGQYRDDLRRICVLFQLNYAQSVELLWAAGHPFDTDDKRDYLIAYCIAEGTYDLEKVDRCLADGNVEPLFQIKDL